MIKANKKSILTLILSTAFCASAGVAVFTGLNSVPVSAETATEETVANSYLTAAGVTLNESIVMNYKVTNLSAATGYTQATMTFTYRGEDYTETKTIGENTELTFAFDKVTPQNMTENVKAVLTLKGDGVKDIVESKDTFSLAEYCNGVLSTNPASLRVDTQAQYEALRTLIADLLNYGDKAQAYRNVNTDNLATSVLNVAQKNEMSDLTAPADTDYALTGSESSATLWKSATLNYDSSIDVVFRFYVKDAEVSDAVTLQVQKDNGNPVTLSDLTTTPGDDGITVYTAVYENLSVTDFDSVFTAQVYAGSTAIGKTLTYSVKSYVYAMANDAGVDEEMVDLAKATYNYGLAAEAYMAAMGGNTIDPTVIISDVQFNSVDDLITAYDVIHNVNYEKIYGFGKFGNYGGGDYVYGNNMVSDGTSLYVLATTSSSGTKYTVDEETTYFRKAVIVKMDAETGEIVGRTASFEAQGGLSEWSNVEVYMSMYLKDGKIYAYDKAHNVLSVNVTDFNMTDGAAWTTASDAVRFENDNTARSVYYNERKQSYAVLNGSTVSIYNEAGELQSSFSAGSSIGATTAAGASTTTSIFRLTGSDNYLYVNYKADDVFTPIIKVFTWDGTLVETLTLPMTQATLGVTVNEDASIQGIAEVNGSLYFTAVEWKTTTTAIIKVGGYTKTAKTALIDALNKGYDLTYTDATFKTWGSVGDSSYVYNATTDGKYLYALSGSTSSMKVVRVNVQTGTQAYTTAFPTSVGHYSWENSPIFHKDGKIFVRGTDTWYSIPANFADNATFNDIATVESLTFTLSNATTLKTSTIGSVYYDATAKKYAVQTGNSSTIYIFDENGSQLTSFTAANITGVDNFTGTATVNATLKRLAGANGYIYVSCYAQGSALPVFNVYDFNGKLIREVRLPNSVENHASPHDCAKMESLVEINGDIYFTVLRWKNNTGYNDSTYIGKVSYTYNEPAPYVSIGEYYETAKENGYEWKYDVTPLNGGSALPTINMFTHGVVTDGTYAYYPSSGGDATSLRIYKTYLGDTTVIGYAKVSVTLTNSYTFSGYSFVKDGYLYVAINNQLWRVATADFTVDFDSAPKAKLVTNDVIAGIESLSNIRGGTYSVENDSYAFLHENGTISILNASGTVVKTIASGGFTRTQITSDGDYIYSLYEKNGEGTLAMHIYDWQGNTVATRALTLTGLCPEEDTSNNNIQGFCVRGNELYIGCCAWKKGYFVYRVTLNTSDWNK